MGLVLCEVLKLAFLEETGSLAADVKYCYERGRIQSDRVDGKTCYTLSSPLHIFYVSWRLMPSVISCPFSTVKDMVFAVIKKFGTIQLPSLISIGGKTLTDRPLEACYQCEFYCGLFALLGGVIIFPELLSAPGSPPGRIDLFIPEKQWGIERGVS
jgi:hypothetical protein